MQLFIIEQCRHNIQLVPKSQDFMPSINPIQNGLGYLEWFLYWMQPWYGIIFYIQKQDEECEQFHCSCLQAQFIVSTKRNGCRKCLHYVGGGKLSYVSTMNTFAIFSTIFWKMYNSPRAKAPYRVLFCLYLIQLSLIIPRLFCKKTMRPSCTAWCLKLMPEIFLSSNSIIKQILCLDETM